MLEHDFGLKSGIQFDDNSDTHMARTKMNVRQQQFGFPDEDLKTSLHDEIVLWLKKNAREKTKMILGWSEAWDASKLETLRTSFAAEVEKRKKVLYDEIAQLEEHVEWYGSDSGHFRQKREEYATRIHLMRNHLKAIDSWAGLDSPPPPRQLNVTSECEVPIIRHRYRTTDIIGYADIVYSVQQSILKFHEFPMDRFEKPDLSSPQTSKLGWWYYMSDPQKIALDAKSTIPSLGQLIRDLKTYRTFCDWPFYVVSPEARFAEAIADEGFGFLQYPEGVFLRPRSHS